MNILVIEDDIEKYGSLYEALNNDPVNAYCFFRAPQDSSEDYLAGMMEIVKAYDVKAVFSLSYYRFVSLACGVLELPYLCWLVKGYEESSFDKTITNPWNYVFSADYDTYLILHDRGLPNLEYLPISYDGADYKNNAHSKDILFVTDNIEELHSTSMRFDLLKDSSKGYIDGVLNSHKADLRGKGLYDNLATYVRDDVKENYPLNHDDLEPVGHKYDNTIFFPLLNNKTQHIMLYHISADWVKEDYNIDVLTGVEPSIRFENKRINYFTNEDYRNYGKKIYGDYKAVIYFPRYSEMNMMTEVMLDIAESETVLLLPGYIHNHVLKELGVPFFRNRYELSKLITKYLFDEESRKKEASRFNEYAGKIESYGSKIARIMKAI